MWLPKGKINKNTEDTKMTVKDFIKEYAELRIISLRTDWQNELYYGHGYMAPKEYETATVKNFCGATPTIIFI